MLCPCKDLSKNNHPTYLRFSRTVTSQSEARVSSSFGLRRNQTPWTRSLKVIIIWVQEFYNSILLINAYPINMIKQYFVWFTVIGSSFFVQYGFLIFRNLSIYGSGGSNLLEFWWLIRKKSVISRKDQQLRINLGDGKG